MNTTKFALASIAGGVTLFLVGGVFYGLLLMDFFLANSPVNVMKENPDFVWLILGELSFAALLTTVIGTWAGASGAGPGARIGAVFGLLLGIAVALTMLGTTNITTPIAAVVDAAVGIIRTGAAGGVIGIVLARS